MSAQPVVAPRRSAPVAPSSPSRGLRAVTDFARRRRPKLSYALIALLGAGAIGAAQLLLSMVITSDAFTLSDLRSQQHELTLQSQALQDELDGLGSPQQLAAQAAGMGLVVRDSASYLSLATGAVSGPNTAEGWGTTVNPTGPGAVANALLTPPAAPAASEKAGDTPVEPALPPAITDGLPSPTTH